jgi:hypothetical protein
VKSRRLRWAGQSIRAEKHKITWENNIKVHLKNGKRTKVGLGPCPTVGFRTDGVRFPDSTISVTGLILLKDSLHESSRHISMFCWNPGDWLRMSTQFPNMAVIKSRWALSQRTDRSLPSRDNSHGTTWTFPSTTTEGKSEASHFLSNKTMRTPHRGSVLELREFISV